MGSIAADCVLIFVSRTLFILLKIFKEKIVVYFFSLRGRVGRALGARRPEDVGEN